MPGCWFTLFTLGFRWEIGPSRLVCIAKSAIAFGNRSLPRG
jgi:hypothetical protein